MRKIPPSEERKRVLDELIKEGAKSNLKIEEEIKGIREAVFSKLPLRHRKQ